MLEVLAVFPPLLGAALAGLGGRSFGDRPSMGISVVLMAVSTLASFMLFIDVAGGAHRPTVTLFTWISSGTFHADWALRMDMLTVVMLMVVNLVSLMVHIYSVGYMSHDKCRPRFFAFLSLFTFMMLMLVTADNLVQMFFGWEGVGLASYLLIGFWFHKDSANEAAIKAFVVNRVGDFGFLLGIFAVFMIFGSVQFDVIFDTAPEMAEARFHFLRFDGHALTIAGLLLFVGAMGKSAQLGLHTWLPDAMEGPTPVSALIHAATMVTAGVFMLARMSPMLEYAPVALTVVTIVGALTCFVAATIGLTQFDIKRVIAYSTMSQLGYMFFAIGVSAYSAAIFHLMTHAFFKALLFLGAGSVIHALSDEQDMRHMGGIAKSVPYTHGLMLIGSLALAGIGIPGVFGFAGFYSKDIILEAAFGDHSWFGSIAFWLGIAAAFMTAFYSWRLLCMTFYGRARADEKVMAHVHESPWVMLGPLVVLAAGAVFAGLIGYEYFVGHELEHFWAESIVVLEANNTIEAAHHVPLWVKWLPLVAAVLGIGLACLFYLRWTLVVGVITTMFQPVHRLFFRKWYFDELYNAVLVRPAFYLGEGLWRRVDGAVIDGVGPDGIAAATRYVSRVFSRLQTGFVYHYAFAMMIGVVALVSWYVMFGA